MAQICSLNIMTSQKTKDYHVHQETFTEWLFRMAAKQGFAVPSRQPPLNRLEALATEVANGLGHGEVVAPFVACLRKVVTLRKEVAAVYSQEANHQVDAEDGHVHAIGVFERILAVFDEAMTREAAATVACRADVWAETCRASDMAVTMQQEAMHREATMHREAKMHQEVQQYQVQQYFELAAANATMYTHSVPRIVPSSWTGYGVYGNDVYGVYGNDNASQDPSSAAQPFVYPAYGNYAPFDAASQPLTTDAWLPQGDIQQTKAGLIERAADGCWVPRGLQNY